MGRLKAYPELREKIHVESTKPVGAGENPEWTLEDHTVNLLARVRRLVRGMELGYPVLLLEKRLACVKCGCLNYEKLLIAETMDDARDMGERPDWCPEPCSCNCMMNLGGTCVGRLDKLRPHDGDTNTHNFCIYKSSPSDPEVEPFRIEFNKSDAYQFGLQMEKVRSDD